MKNLQIIQREIHQYIEQEEAVTAIEYALIASLIAIAIITAVTLVGTNLSTIFTTISSSL